MKKVLFATTALVATAGVAQAEVALSGSAAMGMAGTGGTPGGVNSGFVTDIDVTFTMSGTTDGGLTFGASIDLDESDGSNTAAGAAGTGASAAFGASTEGGETLFISGDFGTVTMGDTDGALDWAMSEVPSGNGFATDAHEGAGWNGNDGLDDTYDGQVLRYDNTFGDFGVAISAEMDDTNAMTAGDPVLGIGFKYSLDLGGNTVSIGLGHQTTTAANVDLEATGLTLGTSFGDLEVGVTFMEGQATGWAEDMTHAGIGFEYSMDAWTFGLHHGAYENVGGVSGVERSSTGVTVSYDLGGGASLRAGGSQSTAEAAGVSTDSEAWAFGLNMSF